METEENNQLPFLDVLIKKKDDGTLSHTVYRKATHTNRYLNAKSHHHPAQLQSVVKTLITRSKRLADKENIDREMKELRTALLQNGFSEKNIKRAQKERSPTTEQEKEKPISKAHLPYVKGTTDRISKILGRHKIETIFKPAKKISAILPNPKTKINLENQGVYEVPCGDCERTYIGQTNRRISVRREEHINAVQKNEKTSSLAQHVKTSGHSIDFQNTKMIANVEHKTRRITREAIEIEKRPNNLNTRDDTQRLPTAWKPALTKHTTEYPKHIGNRSTTPLAERTQQPPRPVTRSRTRNQPGATSHNQETVYKPPARAGNVSSIVTRSKKKQEEKT